MVRGIDKRDSYGVSAGLGSPVEVAEALRTTTGGLAQMRRRGTGPRFLRAGMRRVLYRWTDVDDWLAQADKSGNAPTTGCVIGEMKRKSSSTEGHSHER